MSLKRKISLVDESAGSGSTYKQLKTNENTALKTFAAEPKVSDQSSQQPSKTKNEDDATAENESNELVDDDNIIKAGYIKSIKLINFMCHEHFFIELTPNLNFIIGNNGTGKSAILTAIAVGLGATASQAQRSGQLKGLIRHGSEKASVTIVINNSGDFSYHADIYGDEIVLERTISQTTSKFRVKVDNKFQDMKSTHLRAMLNFLGVRINNPMVFLNQDMAKKFLTSATKKDKYDNFASANYFDFVYSNYSAVANNLQDVEMALSNVKPNLDKLQNEAEKAKQLLNQIKDSKEKIALASDLKKLFAYQKLTTLQEKIKDITTRIIEKTDLIQKCEDIKNRDYTEAVHGFQENVKELDENLVILRQDINEIKDKIRQTKTTKTSFQSEINSLNNDKKFYKEQSEKQKADFAKISKDYDIAFKEFNASSDENNNRLTKKRDDKNKEITDINEQLDKIFDTRNQIDDSLSSLDDERKHKVSQLSRTISENQATFNDLSSKKKDVLSSFGPNMGRCMAEIQNLIKNNKFSLPPIGPLGTLVTIKGEFEAEWAVLVQNRLMNQLNSFIVANQGDKRLLEQTLKKYSLDRRFNFVIRTMTTFNYSRDIPLGNNLIKMTDILEFSSESVKCVFVDLSSVHTLLLAKNYEEAQNLSKKYPYNTVLAVAKSTGFLLTCSNGGNDTITSRRFSRQITMNNQNKYLATLEAELQKDKQEFNDINSHFSRLREDLTTQKAQLIKKEYHLKQKKREIGNEIDKIQSQLDTFQDSNKVDSLKSEVLRMQETINVTNSTLENLDKEIMKQNAEIANLDEDITKLESACATQVQYYRDDEFNKMTLIQKLNDYKHEVKKAESQAVIATNEVSILQDELILMKNEHKAGKENLKAHLDVLRDMMSRFGELSCSQVAKKIATLERDITNNTEFSVQELANLEIGAVDAITKFKKERLNYKSFKSLLTKMQNILHQKKRTYLNHQTDCFNETNKMFIKYMKYRGFVGNLVFQNPYALQNSDSGTGTILKGGKQNEGELSIYARSKEETESRDVDTLSGGEKSFAQMSLLLSTWCVISSRIIALDEFDVFMDNINRTIGTKLIIQSLKDRLQTQTVIITPQDITSIADKYINDPHIKIHKMNAILGNPLSLS
ncbi:hypothetical protein QEN19_002512 [Hanseniaspora menglaensis]